MKHYHVHISKFAYMICNRKVLNEQIYHIYKNRKKNI